MRGASRAGEHCSSNRLPISFLLSLIGDSGVLSRELPLLDITRSPPASPGLRGEVGEVGDRGERGPGPQGEGRGGGRPGEAGEEGEAAALNRHSSLGVRSILILGVPKHRHRAEIDLGKGFFFHY